jgi:hypothetical protein
MTAALQTVEKLIFGMSNGEKAQVLSWVSDNSTENLPGIEKNQPICGDEACIVGARIPRLVARSTATIGTFG